MHKKYDVVAFDLDGTLSDPYNGLISSFAYALRKMGVDFATRSELKRFIGPPLYDEWQKVYSFSPEEATLALHYFHEYFSVYGWWDNVLYDGIPQLLRTLKKRGKKIILATSKPERFAIKVLDLFGIKDLFDFIGAAASEKVRDKKCEVLQYSLDSINVSPDENCVLVGDRVYDAEGARICNIDSIGVLYGYGTEEEINSSGFNYVVKSVEELEKLLQ